MSTQVNIAAQEAFGDAVNTGKFEAFEALVAADSIDHDPAPGQGPGPQGYRDYFTEMRTAFPDFRVEVEHLVAAGEDVAFAYVITGTHEGPFLGHEPTRRKFSIRGMQISRFEGGRLVERWGSSDQAGLLTQLHLK
jgi:steroid delta-isomerase-like uncharacterized protein